MVIAMVSLLIRDVVRHVKQTKRRFFSIVAIMALGIGFYSGLNSAGLDMRQNLEQYLERSHAYNLVLTSALGIDDEIMDDIKGVEGVNAVEPAYSYDTLVDAEGKDITARFESYLEDGFNEFELVSGRTPEKTNEILAPASLMNSESLKLGSVVSLKDPDLLENKLSLKEFTVVGFVNSFEYLNTSLFGLSNKGPGIIQSYFLLDKQAFKEDVKPDKAFIFLDASYYQDGFLAANNEYLDDAITQIDTQVAHGFKNELRQKSNTARQDALQYKNSLRQGSSGVIRQLDEAKNLLAGLRKTAGLSADQSAQDEQDLNAHLEAYKSELDALTSRQGSSKKEIVVKNAYNADFEAFSDDASDRVNPLAAFEQDIMGSEQSLEQIKSRESALKEEIVSLRQEAQGLQSAGRAQAEASNSAVVPGSGNTQQAQSATSKELSAVLETLQEREVELTNLQAQEESLNSNIQQGKSRYAEAKTRLEHERKLASMQRGELFKLSDLSSWEEKLKQNKLSYTEAQRELISLLQASLESIKRNISALDNQKELLTSLGDTPYLIEKIRDALGIKSYLDDTERLDNIARIFPLFFFVIALLVALTTMTRLCDDERSNIGIYASLGFSKFFLSLKYFSYAALACLLGMLIGILFGNIVFPWLIELAYESIYALAPRANPLSYELFANSSLIASCVGASLVLAGLASLPSLYAQLKEKPARILLKKAPVPGKKIFLEHLPLWNALNFSQKISLRNVFRFKRRFVMMLVGVAGSCALLLVAFGLYNAVSSAYTLQFETIQHYDGIARTNTSSKAEHTIFAEGVESFDLHTQKIIVKARNEELVWNIVSPLNKSELTHEESKPRISDFIQLKDVWSHEELSLAEDSCIVPLKFAQEYSLKPGDALGVFASNLLGKTSKEEITLHITGVYENYIGNMIFMGSEIFAKDFPNASKDSIALVRTNSNFAPDGDLAAMMQENSQAESFELSQETQKRFESSLGAVKLVVALLITSSILLMIIVLYNLISINIQERFQEIATLKVLGFKKRELIEYFLREIFIQLVLGALLGLILGSLLLSFVITTAEVHYMSFVHEVHLFCFVEAFVLTVLVGTLICFTTLPALSKIPMVESLKSMD